MKQEEQDGKSMAFRPADPVGGIKNVFYYYSQIEIINLRISVLGFSLPRKARHAVRS